jgi:hypothetical protein
MANINPMLQIAPKPHVVASPHVVAPQAPAPEFTAVNTAGTVRVNNLSNAESVLNFVANGTEAACLLWSAFLLFVAFKKLEQSELAACLCKAALAIFVASVGLAIPGAINWLFDPYGGCLFT